MIIDGLQVLAFPVKLMRIWYNMRIWEDLR